MRHQVRGRKLGRTSSHRKATLEALSNALIKNERITTTLPKAKELRKFVEPLITRSKVDNLLNRRIVFSALRDKEIVKKIFEEVGPLVADRPGGYTRIVKVGNRSGDGAPVAIIELVDYNDSKPETAGKKKKRTRRGSGKAKDETSTTARKPSTDKAEAKKPAGETAAAPAVEDEEAAPVAEKTAEPVQEVKIENTAEAEVKTDEPADTAEDTTTAKSESAEEKAADETVTKAAEEKAADESEDKPGAESADAVTGASDVAEEKAEAGNDTEAKAPADTDASDVAEKKAEAGDDTKAKTDTSSESETSSDDKKKDEDKDKTDK